MLRTTQKELRALAERYTDITYANEEDRKQIKEKEGWLEEIAYSVGIYGCNGKAFRGANTGEIYVIKSRSSALYLFN